MLFLWAVASLWFTPVANAADVTWFTPSAFPGNSNANWPAVNGTYTQNFGVAFTTGSSGPYTMGWVKLALNTSSVTTGAGSLKLALHATNNSTAYSAVAVATVHAVDTINFTMPTTTSTPFTLTLTSADIPNITGFAMSAGTAYALIAYAPSVNIGMMRQGGYANGTTNNNYTVSNGFSALDTFRNNSANYRINDTSYPTLSFSFGTTAASPPGAPTGLSATPGDGTATIAFTAPASDGGAAISNYEYSTDDGGNWTPRSPVATTSPLTITGLTNGTAYSVKLRAVNSAGAGTASSAVSVTPTICGDGIPLTTGSGALWQPLALPCVPSASPASVANVFGNSPTANLDAALYDVGDTGWILYRREVTTTPSSYVKLLDSDTVTNGAGYWIKSFAAPVDGKLTVAGTSTPTDVAAPACASANGCKAIALTTVLGQNRYNLVGNPFPYAIDWSKVRIRVGGNGGTIYSPCQAAGISSGCSGPAASPASPPVINNAINIWECTPTCDYHVYSDLSPDQGNLKYFMSFWVNVLPGAYNQTVELLIPAEASTRAQASPAALPWYLAWLDWIAGPAEAAPQPTTSEWWVSLKLKNHVNGGESGTVRLGQLGTAQTGYDAHDLPKLAPFAAPYLSLVFPHPDWDPKAGDYATDYRPTQGNQPQDWTFEVRADPATGVVFLSWEGDARKLKRMRLIDVQTGKTIQPAAKKWSRKGYPITLQNPVQRYIWRYLGK